MSTSESPNVVALKNWLATQGGGFHPHVVLSKVPSGFSVIAGDHLPQDVKVVTCPFRLAITKTTAQDVISRLVSLPDASCADWNERQWICVYICFHQIVEDARLSHSQYISTLPSPEKLRTSLHFTPLELELFKGTNLYGATHDRQRDWQTEWRQCQSAVACANAEWGSKFTWEAYLSAATYLSSRAFPSSILSATPSLEYSPSTHPILLPGIDSLNHARGQPVSWVVSYPDTNATEGDHNEPTISLVLHTSAVPGQELFNNYGAKPNSELILGYGFSISQNPDDTILLKIGGIDGKKWEVGRTARGVDGLWDEILASIVQDPESGANYEDHLDAAGIMMDMVQAMLNRLPHDRDDRQVEMRPEVALMLHNYVEGQRDILESVIEFAQEKERLAIEAARAEGIELVLEDE